jgi:membrane-bound serine protease (ClpP class)
MLRPAGTVFLGADRVDAMSEGEVIPAGTPVRVVGIRGASVLVRPIREGGEP